MKKILIYSFTASLILNLFLSGNLYSQWTYGNPFSVLPPSDSWQQVDSKVPVAGNVMLQSVTKPYLTNEWFNVLFLYGSPFPYPDCQGE